MLFSKLSEALQKCDSTCSHYLEIDQLQHVCDSVGLPLSKQLIHGTIMKYFFTLSLTIFSLLVFLSCPMDKAGRVQYQKFVEFLSWTDHSITMPDANVSQL